MFAPSGTPCAGHAVASTTEQTHVAPRLARLNPRGSLEGHPLLIPRLDHLRRSHSTTLRACSLRHAAAGARAVIVGAASARAACARGWRAARPPSCTRACACGSAAGVFGEGGAAARTVEVQLGAALADLLQRLSERANPNHASRPAELARLAATRLRCSRTLACAVK